MAWAMPERFGVAAAGRRVRCSRHEKPRSPRRHNIALCLVAGPEHLEGEVSRYVSRLRHRERQINITSRCAAAGKAKPTPSLAANKWSEKRCFGCSLMPAAERSEVLSARVGWFVAPVCEPEMDCLISGAQTGAMSPAPVGQRDAAGWPSAAARLRVARRGSASADGSDSSPAERSVRLRPQGRRGADGSLARSLAVKCQTRVGLRSEGGQP